jgi:prolyl oligopeptidase
MLFCSGRKNKNKSMLKKHLLLLSILSWGALYAQNIHYPPARKSDVSDTYFGIPVADPYRWMEDDNAPETTEWVKKENEVTDAYLNTIPFRDSLKRRMSELWDYPKYTSPYKAGKRYFYFKNTGLQNQPVLYVMPGLNFVPMMYFDPNKLSEDGTVSIQNISAGKDGKYLAFIVNKAGSDWSEIRIKEVANMKTLPEVLSWIKFSGIAWKDSGFYYSRYDAPAGNEFTGRNENHKIYYHQLNTPQTKDALIWQDAAHPLRNFSASTTDDEKFLVISGTESTSGNNVMIQDLSRKTGKLITVVEKFDHTFTLVGSTGKELLFVTNYKAPKKRLIAINPLTPAEAAWREIIPEQKDILLSVSLAGKKLLVHYMKDASSHLYIYNQGKKESEIPLGNFGTVSEINSSPYDSVLFFSFETFTAPPTVYRFNLNNNLLYTHFQAKLPYNPDDYVTEQIFYTSSDQTKIPMFLVHKKGMQLTEETPALLFGYGGFDISKTPEFKPERLVFLEKGGLFAMANIRGGGEYGEAWHKAGTRLLKQNVFNDFIAAGEYLVHEKFTSPSKLAISGRSNGGLLVGAVMLQRPDLFKVALPAVGVMDMLRYHKFTIGWAWASDYGTSDTEEEFKALYKYSPLHNIKEGVQYPATMITTADHDDRVVPAHSFKFAATLQEKYKGTNPVLIRIDSNAGHGPGKPTLKLIDEQADIFAFMMYHLGMKY